MHFETLITELKKLINTTKTLYYENLSKKLNNPLLQAKTYWSILKTFYDEKNIPLIPPLLVDDKFVTDIRMEACIFTKSSAEQYTPLKNECVLPFNQIFLSQSSLRSLDFKEDKIIRNNQIIQNNQSLKHISPWLLMISPLE